MVIDQVDAGLARGNIQKTGEPDIMLLTGNQSYDRVYNFSSIASIVLSEHIPLVSFCAFATNKQS